MMRRAFDDVFTALIAFGVAVGLAVAGLIWLLVWLWQHVRIEWVA